MDSKDTFFSHKQSLNCKGRLVQTNPALVMGVLNITPDSFYPGSRITDMEEIKSRAVDMIKQGADILDVGAFSSRPGSAEISQQEEMERLAAALPVIRESFPRTILSVDTYRSVIARKVVEDYGVDMINDISGGELDPEMFPVMASLKVPYILMHMKGSPANMQEHARYTDILSELIQYFSERIDRLNRLGVNDIIIDPGFGFAKTAGHNFEILRQLEAFGVFKQPLLVGLSRKSMIYRTLDTDSSKALNGSTVLNTIALLKGADILRVHDVKEAKEAVLLVNRTMEPM